MGLSNVLKGTLAATAYAAVGALVVLVIGYIVYLESRPPLEPWHLATLSEEFTTRSPVKTFAEYQALEDRLFAQLSELVYAKTASAETQRVNRYAAGSLADPRRWSPDWNRSFELPAADLKAGVLLLHGMSDSPYSLRGLGQRLNAAGAQVLGLRLPGHGTAPVGLVAVTWQDMAAGVRLALEHLKQQVGERPIYVVGYSNGAALGVHYALQTLADANLPRLKGLVLLSPAIGVSPAAAFAVWQARLGRLLGLDQLAWSGILPEYDPFKYGSFAVNAGDVVYRLTAEIRDRMTALGKAGRLDAFPPVMAFASVVDATVSTPALVEGLFARLPKGGHELVLFDINRVAGMGPLLAWDPGPIVQALQDDPGRTFTVSLLSNAKDQGPGLAIYAKRPGEAAAASDPGLSWPAGVYSLSHVALPFPPDDALYGGQPRDEGPGLRLGNTALRGERGVLEVPATELMRLRWNPFYPYVEARTLGFLGLAAP